MTACQCLQTKLKRTKADKLLLPSFCVVSNVQVLAHDLGRASSSMSITISVGSPLTWSSNMGTEAELGVGVGVVPVAVKPSPFELLLSTPRDRGYKRWLRRTYTSSKVRPLVDAYERMPNKGAFKRPEVIGFEEGSVRVGVGKPGQSRVLFAS
jgi:hypothetical protein